MKRIKIKIKSAHATVYPLRKEKDIHLAWLSHAYFIYTQTHTNIDIYIYSHNHTHTHTHTYTVHTRNPSRMHKPDIQTVSICHLP